jgi:pre-peptidase
MKAAVVLGLLGVWSVPVLAQRTPPAAPASGAQARPTTPQSTQSAVTADTTLLPPQEIGTIHFGQARSGILESGDYTMGDQTWADVWYFEATAGQRITIELVSRQFDPYVQLLDPWGGKLAEDDDSGEGNSSHLVFTFRDAGRYQIIVNNSGDEARTGTYVLTVR